MDFYLSKYLTVLKIEKNMSLLTIEAYSRDLSNYLNYLKSKDIVVDIGANDCTLLNFYPNSLRLVGFEPAQNIKFIEAGMISFMYLRFNDSLKKFRYVYNQIIS